VCLDKLVGALRQESREIVCPLFQGVFRFPEIALVILLARIERLNACRLSQDIQLVEDRAGQAFLVLVLEVEAIDQSLDLLDMDVLVILRQEFFPFDGEEVLVVGVVLELLRGESLKCPA